MLNSPLTTLLMKCVLLWLHREFLSPLFILARLSPSINEPRPPGWSYGDVFQLRSWTCKIKRGEKSLWSNKIPVLIGYICIIKWISPAVVFEWIGNWWTVIVITRVCCYSQCITIKFTRGYFQSLAGLRGMFPLLQSPSSSPHLMNLFGL